MSFIRSFWQGFSARYVRFVEQRGFMIILAVCVAVIAGTAAWTNHPVEEPPTPTTPVGDAASVAQLQQQTLSEAILPTPAPTAPVPVWQSPVKNVSVLRGFDATRLVVSGVTGLWQLHDAVDLRCTAGETILAMTDGHVVAATDKGLQGASVTIDHNQDILIEYAGMALHAGLRPGDPIKAGQVIGFAGNGMMDETDMEPHLHLRATRSGQSFDPLSLLRN